ncbi:hypothetical protein D9M72_490710 [compost metagenome]
MQRFDDDALHPEVVAPDFFHEFGVVLAFHPDAAGLGDLGAPAFYPHGTGRRPAGSGRGCLRSRRRGHQPDRQALQEEPVAEPERA